MANIYLKDIWIERSIIVLMGAKESKSFQRLWVKAGWGAKPDFWPQAHPSFNGRCVYSTHIPHHKSRIYLIFCFDTEAKIGERVKITSVPQIKKIYILPNWTLILIWREWVKCWKCLFIDITMKGLRNNLREAKKQNWTDVLGSFL